MRGRLKPVLISLTAFMYGCETQLLLFAFTAGETRLLF